MPRFSDSPLENLLYNYYKWQKSRNIATELEAMRSDPATGLNFLSPGVGLVGMSRRYTPRMKQMREFGRTQNPEFSKMMAGEGKVPIDDDMIRTLRLKEVEPSTFQDKLGVLKLLKSLKSSTEPAFGPGGLTKGQLKEVLEKVHKLDLPPSSGTQAVEANRSIIERMLRSPKWTKIDKKTGKKSLVSQEGSLGSGKPSGQYKGPSAPTTTTEQIPLNELQESLRRAIETNPNLIEELRRMLGEN